jgi:prevent-host-death family protein
VNITTCLGNIDMAAETVIPAAEANRSFSKLLAQVRDGKSFVVTSHGKPVARLSPVDEKAAEEAAAELVAREERWQRHLERLRTQPLAEKPAGKWTREELYEDSY